MTLRELRLKEGIPLKEASEITGIPMRTYIRYEKEPEKENTIKYKHALNTLAEYTRIDEDKGILSIDAIRTGLGEVFKDKDVSFCILFGSYAKNRATEKSDIDLVVNTGITGLAFYGLVEEIREKLKKKVDLLRIEDLTENTGLLSEVLKDGVKVYG